MKFLRILVPAVLVLAGACSKIDPNDKGIISDCITSLELDTESNAMRVKVTAKLNKECDWNVKFWRSDADPKTARQTKTKRASGESDALLLFLEPATDYTYVVNVNGQPGTEERSFTTSKRPRSLVDLRIIEKNVDDWVDGYILQCNSTSDGFVTLCDYDGKMVWYEYFGVNSRISWYNPVSGLLSVYCSGLDKNDDETNYMIIADLGGNIKYKAKADATTIPRIHHDLKILDNGNMIALSRVPKVFDGVTYMGEGITEIDQNGNKVFQWDTNNDFNPIKTPYISYRPDLGDYLHANSIEKDSNGDYYMNLNWLTEIIKVDGKTGKLLYRFGPNGDVTITGERPEIYHSGFDYTKFFTENSGVHTSIALEPDRILCLANGKDSSISKAVIVKIDPVKKQAHYEMIVDFERRFQCPDRSNVSLLPGGRLLLGSAPWNMIIVTDQTGKTLRVLERFYISPRSIYYAPEDFNCYFDK